MTRDQIEAGLWRVLRARRTGVVTTSQHQQDMLDVARIMRGVDDLLCSTIAVTRAVPPPGDRELTARRRRLLAEANPIRFPNRKAPR